MTNKKVVPEKTTEKSPADNAKQEATPKELGGRDGPDPVRYGDWENKGIVSDF
tara:strand:- start:68441 stop:68599 length:159 start_codon:yes stop_codon:yes gene_type:complete